MDEQDLRELGITIEPFMHRHGSPYGQYWGYIVARQNKDGHPTLYGKQSSGNKMPTDPFAHRTRAWEFALTLYEQQKQKDQEDQEGGDHGYNPDEDPWIDIGGES